jgi:putative colanic acid biosynthesis acetyltransferase WcaF
MASMPLITAPIQIGDDAWITSDVFIGPGVCIGDGAVIAARSTVTRNVEAWTVVSGNPAEFRSIRRFDLRPESAAS